MDSASSLLDGWSLAALPRGVRPAALVLLLVLLGALPPQVQAQQRVAYIDSGYVLDQIPEYAAIDPELERLADQWEQEIAVMERELAEKREEFQARELLYTDREREERREEIVQLTRQIEQQRQHYFGPDGELFAEQQRLLRPIQARVLNAVERIAERQDYDYVFDKAGDFLFLFASEQHDLSDAVLAELGIDID